MSSSLAHAPHVTVVWYFYLIFSEYLYSPVKIRQQQNEKKNEKRNKLN